MKTATGLVIIMNDNGNIKSCDSPYEFDETFKPLISWFEEAGTVDKEVIDSLITRNIHGINIISSYETKDRPSINEWYQKHFKPQ